MTQALLIVDVQNDFMPRGPMPVQEGDAVVPVINRLQPHFEHVLATKDWHPAGHSSFNIWPEHCVQGSEGAEFARGLDTNRFEKVFEKGIDSNIDSYGGFYDNDWKRKTGLEEYLHERGIDHLVVVGVATDYCVKFTVLDGLKLGFAMTVVTDGCRAIGDEAAALAEMKEAGAKLTTSAEIPN
jgi:nicotinamidase/pyrazinamidase